MAKMSFFDRGFYDYQQGKHWTPDVDSSANDIRDYFQGRGRAAELEIRSRQAMAARKPKTKKEEIFLKSKLVGLKKYLNGLLSVLFVASGMVAAGVWMYYLYQKSSATSVSMSQSHETKTLKNQKDIRQLQAIMIDARLWPAGVPTPEFLQEEESEEEDDHE